MYFPRFRLEGQQKVYKPPVMTDDIMTEIQNKYRTNTKKVCEISSSHGGEYDVQSCLLSDHSSLMMEAVRTSETSVDNHFTRQYNPEDSSEHKEGILPLR
jgi:hypothetical protein